MTRTKHDPTLGQTLGSLRALLATPSVTVEVLYHSPGEPGWLRERLTPAELRRVSFTRAAGSSNAGHQPIKGWGSSTGR